MPKFLFKCFSAQTDDISVDSLDFTRVFSPEQNVPSASYYHAKSPNESFSSNISSIEMETSHVNDYYDNQVSCISSDILTSTLADPPCRAYKYKQSLDQLMDLGDECLEQYDDFCRLPTAFDSSSSQHKSAMDDRPLPPIESGHITPQRQRTRHPATVQTRRNRTKVGSCMTAAPSPRHTPYTWKRTSTIRQSVLRKMKMINKGRKDQHKQQGTFRTIALFWSAMCGQCGYIL